MAKLYKKQYEDIYTVDHLKQYKLDLDQISGVTMAYDEYTDQFKDLLKCFYFDLFNYYVKLSWLRRNFVYKNRKIKYPINHNPQYLNSAFLKYLRRIVGMDIQIITRGINFSAIESYFDELFPGFEEGNPFENPEYYKFPFKNLSIDFLLAVYHMEERVMLLKEADRVEMTIAQFYDFVVNHVKCLNDELEEPAYEVFQNRHRGVSFYVKNLKEEI
jgi:hypothetical protein